MDTTKFFYLIMKGENLPVDEIEDKIGLKGEKYRKGEYIVKKYRTEKKIFQSINRWIYIAYADDNIKASQFLYDQLKILYKKRTIIQDYAKKNNVFFDLRIYSEDKTDIIFTKRNIHLLDKIGISLKLSFC